MHERSGQDLRAHGKSGRYVNRGESHNQVLEPRHRERMVIELVAKTSFKASVADAGLDARHSGTDDSKRTGTAVLQNPLVVWILRQSWCVSANIELPDIIVKENTISARLACSKTKSDDKDVAFRTFPSAVTSSRQSGSARGGCF